jgi:hypothetical protein
LSAVLSLKPTRKRSFLYLLQEFDLGGRLTNRSSRIDSTSSERLSV